MIIVLLSGLGCASPSIPNRAQLFAQTDASTSTVGQATILLTTADIGCDGFKDGLSAADLWRPLEGENGVILTLSFSLSDEDDSSGWVGSFAPGGYDPAMSDGSTVYSTRTASATWFDEAGFWQQESSGLVVQLDEYSSDGVSGRINHVWSTGSFNAEACGSY